MTLFEAATLASNIAIGLGQIGIVWYAVRAMTRSAKDRSAGSRPLRASIPIAGAPAASRRFAGRGGCAVAAGPRRHGGYRHTGPISVSEWAHVFRPLIQRLKSPPD